MILIETVSAIKRCADDQPKSRQDDPCRYDKTKQRELGFVDNKPNPNVILCRDSGIRDGICEPSRPIKDGFHSSRKLDRDKGKRNAAQYKRKKQACCCAENTCHWDPRLVNHYSIPNTAPSVVPYCPNTPGGANKNMMPKICATGGVDCNLGIFILSLDTTWLRLEHRD